MYYQQKYLHLLKVNCDANAFGSVIGSLRIMTKT